MMRYRPRHAYVPIELFSTQWHGLIKRLKSACQKQAVAVHSLKFGTKKIQIVSSVDFPPGASEF